MISYLGAKGLLGKNCYDTVNGDAQNIGRIGHGDSVMQIKKLSSMGINLLKNEGPMMKAHDSDSGYIFNYTTGRVRQGASLRSGLELCTKCRKLIKQVLQKKLMEQSGPHSPGSIIQHFVPFAISSTFQPSALYLENR